MNKNNNKKENEFQSSSINQPLLSNQDFIQQHPYYNPYGGYYQNAINSFDFQSPPTTSTTTTTNTNVYQSQQQQQPQVPYYYAAVDINNNNSLQQPLVASRSLKENYSCYCENYHPEGCSTNHEDYRAICYILAFGFLFPPIWGYAMYSKYRRSRNHKIRQMAMASILLLFFVPMIVLLFFAIFFLLGVVKVSHNID